MTTSHETDQSEGRLDRLGALFRAHHDHLVRLAMVCSGDSTVADDVAQEAFVRLGRVRRWPEPGTELAYLRRTVVNLVHGHHRKLATRRAPRLRVVATEPVDPATHASQRDVHRQVAEAVRALPRRQRDCVALHYYAGLTDAEVAATLDIGVGSVKTHLHRARATLADALEALR